MKIVFSGWFSGALPSAVSVLSVRGVPILTSSTRRAASLSPTVLPSCLIIFLLVCLLLEVLLGVWELCALLFCFNFYLNCVAFSQCLEYLAVQDRDWCFQRGGPLPCHSSTLVKLNLVSWNSVPKQNTEPPHPHTKGTYKRPEDRK